MIQDMNFRREVGNLTSIYTYSKEAYKTKKKEKYKRLLRELIFVRLISALEVFLIENIKDIFVLTKEPFREYSGPPVFSNNSILNMKSISQAHAVIINKICRDLSGRGFKEISEFYRKRFNVEFLSLQESIGLNLEKCHDERHLLVHKMGKIDKYYKNAYPEESNMKEIKIDEEYLIECFKKLKRFSIDLSSILNEKIQILEIKNPEKFERRIKIYVILKDDSIKILNKDFSYWVNEELICLGDLIFEYSKPSQKSFSFTLGGSLGEIRGFLRHLKKAQRKNQLIYELLENVDHLQNPFQARPSRLTKTQMEEIRSKLPEQPWPKFTHKRIASEMDLSNGKVSRAIQELINEGFFKDQKGGIIIEG